MLLIVHLGLSLLTKGSGDWGCTRDEKTSLNLFLILTKKSGIWAHTIDTQKGGSRGSRYDRKIGGPTIWPNEAWVS